LWDPDPFPGAHHLTLRLEEQQRLTPEATEPHVVLVRDVLFRDYVDPVSLSSLN